jgi:hypothetical protein
MNSWRSLLLGTYKHTPLFKPKYFTLLAAVISTLSILPTSVTAADVIVPAGEDSLINSTDNTNNNTGQYANLLASETGPTNGYWGSWIKFDLSPLAGLSVGTAYLELTTFFNHSSTPIAHQVFSSSNDSWLEGSITGFNQPLESTLTPLDVTTIPNINGVYRWDVSAAVNGTDGKDNGVLSLFIRPETYPDVSRGPHFRSSEAGMDVPILRVTAVPEPSSLLMLTAGLALLFSLSYGRKQQARSYLAFRT